MHTAQIRPEPDNKTDADILGWPYRQQCSGDKSMQGGTGATDPQGDATYDAIKLSVYAGRQEPRLNRLSVAGRTDWGRKSGGRACFCFAAVIQCQMPIPPPFGRKYHAAREGARAAEETVHRPVTLPVYTDRQSRRLRLSVAGWIDEALGRCGAEAGIYLVFAE